MRVPRWVLPVVVVSVLAPALIGCDRESDQRPSRPDTLRSYQPRAEEVRRKLAQVKALLPSARVDRASCRTKAPLTPTFRYRPKVENEHERAEENAEILMERSLTEPDTRLHFDQSFQYADTELLHALHWTGPRGPLGENHYELHPPPAYYDESRDRELRAKLEHGLDTRYLVVLRVVKYTPPTSLDEPTRTGFFGEVALDGFVVDLHQLSLLCSFTAAGRYEALHVVNIRPGDSWAGRLYEELQQSAGYEIAEKLTSLTGGTADPPETTTAWK